jgi:UDP-2,3-diacylglucosamine hydrolase
MLDTLLISDIHLSAERPDTVELFLRFLRDKAARSQRLYILGDLFDVWVGDDDTAQPIPEILKGMSDISSRGCQLFFIRGNRDFLIGERFSRESGCALLHDTAVINIAGVSTLLLHGDLLVTNDEEYQRDRIYRRSAAFREEFLGKPLAERKEIANGLRQLSMETKAGLTEYAMDVVEDAVKEQLRRHNTWQMVHGHIHTPGKYDLRLDSRPAQRFVLGEWLADSGHYLANHGDGLESHIFR